MKRKLGARALVEDPGERRFQEALQALRARVSTGPAGIGCWVSEAVGGAVVIWVGESPPCVHRDFISRVELLKWASQVAVDPHVAIPFDEAISRVESVTLQARWCECTYESYSDEHSHVIGCWEPNSGCPCGISKRHFHTWCGGVHTIG